MGILYDQLNNEIGTISLDGDYVFTKNKDEYILSQYEDRHRMCKDEETRVHRDR